jgi:hypothetical protein
MKFIKKKIRDNVITKNFIPNYFFMNFMFCNYFFIITNSYGFRRGFVRFMEHDIK